MIRVLFVDDEPAVLEGLENSFRRLRKRWKMTFACGVEAAFAALEESRFEVIVSDVRMPTMDGAELLLRVRSKFPHMVRIVLSGQSDRENLLQSLPVAHRVLSKPCDPETMREAIERAYELDRFVANPSVREMVSGIQGLPTLPDLYLRISEALEQDEPSLRELGGIVAEDVAITARLLQTVNSAFFALSRPILSAEDAATYLGLNGLRSLVLSLELFSRLDAERALLGFSLEHLQKHSLLAARAAARVAKDAEIAKAAASSAMLHDVGTLVLATALPSFYDEVLPLATAEQLPVWRAEKEVHGYTHAQVGAYVLSLWGLPFPVVEAVAHHHEPGLSGEEEFGLVGAVHVAENLAHAWSDAETHPERHAAIADKGLDRSYLERVGESPELSDWLARYPEAEEPQRKAS